MKRILALDLAAETGYAVQRSNGTIETGTTMFLKAAVEGRRWLRFHDWLAGWIEFDAPELLIFEEPFIHMKHRSGLGLSYGFKTITQYLAAKNEIRCYSIAPTQLKLWATGHGNASKDQMKIYARSLGWTLTNDNEIDARFLLYYAQERIRRAKGAA